MGKQPFQLSTKSPFRFCEFRCSTIVDRAATSSNVKAATAALTTGATGALEYVCIAPTLSLVRNLGCPRETEEAHGGGVMHERPAGGRGLEAAAAHCQQGYKAREGGVQGQPAARKRATTSVFFLILSLQLGCQPSTVLGLKETPGREAVPSLHVWNRDATHVAMSGKSSTQHQVK